MREPTREEKERLRAKIREERKRQHEIVMETARKSDEEDMGDFFHIAQACLRTPQKPERLA